VSFNLRGFGEQKTQLLSEFAGYSLPAMFGGMGRGEEGGGGGGGEGERVGRKEGGSCPKLALPLLERLMKGGGWELGNGFKKRAR